VYPELDALILAPICPHSLSQRPLVIPNYETVSIEIRHPSAAALLCIDGDVRHTLRSGDSVQVYRGSKYVQLVMDPAQNFYQVLQSKLKWGA
jgi:NAD+ kinase